MLFPPVARIVATPGWFISAPVASSDGSVIQLMQSAGAPAATAASRTTLAASAEHFCAAGWNANTIAHNFIHRPFFRARALNTAFSCYLSLLLGFPQSLWRARHLAHHGAQNGSDVSAHELVLL